MVGFEFGVDWVGEYSDGLHTCLPPADSTSSRNLVWDPLRAGSSGRFRFYLIYLDAISPNDPNGSPDALRTLYVPVQI